MKVPGTTSQYYVMYGAGTVFFSGSGKKVPKSLLRLHNAASTCTGASISRRNSQKIKTEQNQIGTVTGTGTENKETLELS